MKCKYCNEEVYFSEDFTEWFHSVNRMYCDLSDNDNYNKATPKKEIKEYKTDNNFMEMLKAL